MRRSDCPAELKILVADMLTAYDNYKSGHAALFDAQTLDQISDVACQTVESYLENRMIWEELNHYKTTGDILGKHPIFEWTKRINAIRQMKISHLVTLKMRLENNLIRTRAKLKRQKGHKLTSERITRVAEFEKELSGVNRLLNF